MQCRMLCLGLVLIVQAPARAENWPGWRGPRGDGTSAETGVPIRWTQNENIQWQVAIAGKGHSSPIVWNDRIFLTTCVEESQKRDLLCLDRRDGHQLWARTVVRAQLEAKHGLNSYASSTPATDGKHVWVSFLAYPDMVVACYDFEGNEIWRQIPGKFYSKHGFCSPPILYKDLVMVNGDQDAEAFLVALDKNTGAERWRTDRPNRTRSYCPPLLIESGGKKQIVLSGSKCVASYDPDTGKAIWIIQGPTEQFVASLVFLDNVLCLTAGFPEYHLMGINPDGHGDVTSSHVVWHHKCKPSEASYVPSPIANEKYFFVVSDLGFGRCLEAKTGRPVWMQRLGRHHSASPVSAGGHLYFVDDDGKTFVIKGSGQYELVSRNPLGEECYASPAISGGQIFIRTLHHLYCIGDPATAVIETKK